MSERRVPHGGGLVLGIIMGLIMWALLFSLAVAQAPAPKQPFYIFADTAGVSAIGENTYITWVFAKTTPSSLPSSGVLVGFDCNKRLVQRFAHVVYQLTQDSVGVTGKIVEDVTGWVPMSNPRLFNLVCSIGPTHAPLPKKFEADSVPAVKPQSPYFSS